MVFVNASNFFSSLARGATQAAAHSSQSVGQVAREFFKDLFLHPTHHIPVVIFFCVIILGAIVGVAYLTKLAYDRYRKEQGY